MSSIMKEGAVRSQFFFSPTDLDFTILRMVVFRPRNDALAEKQQLVEAIYSIETSPPAFVFGWRFLEEIEG
jgi:hypothetical protein